MNRDEYEASVSTFIRLKGVTRCPTACALPTQGTIPPADRAALERYAEIRGRLRRQKIAAGAGSFWGASVLAGPGE